jgi:predicted nuclease of predicted toxin-antitoxin system
MRCLADESCHFAVVRMLRSAGHDVVAIAHVQRGASDDVVLNLAAQDHRILLTSDKDFGQLFYSRAGATSTVILMRYPPQFHVALANAVRDLVSQQGDSLVGSFVVVQPGQNRIGRPPPA